MPSTIDFKVDGKVVTVKATEGAVPVTHTAVVTNAAGAIVFMATFNVGANEPVNQSQTFPTGTYHFRLTGTDSSVFDVDFTIPTTPPKEKMDVMKGTKVKIS
jgi:hypothetical protein